MNDLYDHINWGPKHMKETTSKIEHGMTIHESTTKDLKSIAESLDHIKKSGDKWQINRNFYTF